MNRRYFILLMLVVSLMNFAIVRAEDRQSETGSVEGITVTSDVVYGHKFGMALTFDVYRPQQQNGAAVIFIISGGWISMWRGHLQFEKMPDGTYRTLSREKIKAIHPTLPSFSFEALLSKGFTVFRVRHGSSPKFGIPEIVADLRQAVRFIRAQSQQYGVEAERIGLWGGSAGGHLALLLGTTSDDGNPEAEEPLERVSSRVAAVVSYFPPSEMRRLFDNLKPEVRARFPAIFLQAEEYKMYSPLYFASSDDAPTLIIHGDKDTLVPIVEGTSMYEALSHQGVASRFVTIPGAGHGFLDADAERALGESVVWFEKYLRVK